MARVRIHNDDWGLESNCFVCEPRNESGLRIPFFHDTDRDVVTAEFELGDAHSGAPTLVHGGIALAILDEAMAWACIAIGRQWAVTTETSTRFERAVKVGHRYTVEAEVTGRDATTMTTAGRIIGARGEIRASAVATFTMLGEAQATRLAGGELNERTRGLTNERP